MNASKLAQLHFDGHPSIRDCLLGGTLNFSAVARNICRDHNIRKFEAVLIAIRRLSYKLKKQAKVHEESILSLIKDAKLRVGNKIIVVILEKPRDMEQIYLFQKKVNKEKNDINVIEGEDVITLVTNHQYKKFLTERFGSRMIKLIDGLVQITMLFDERIENTSGVVSYLYSLLAEKGINIQEEMSCWTDLMIIIDEKDMAKAMGVLSR